LSGDAYGEKWGPTGGGSSPLCDTKGYEKKKNREGLMWAISDWVIRALNNDMSY